MRAKIAKTHTPQPRTLRRMIALTLMLPLATFARGDPPGSPNAEPASGQTAEPRQAAANDTAPDVADQFALEETSAPRSNPEKRRALIETHSSIEVGAAYTSKDSYRFGRYTGLNKQGTTPILNLDVFHRGPYDGNDASYFSIKSVNLGLDSRQTTIEFGTQGKYGIRFDHDEIPLFRSDSTRTIFDGAGSTHLTLPANWVGSGSTAGMTQLLPDLKSIPLKTQRRRTGLGIHGVLSPRWDYTASYKYETKTGNQSIGAVFGNTGGNPRTVIIPQPVDYTTQQVDAALHYTTGKFQLDAAYYLSLFSDKNNALVWANPYSAINGWAPGTGFPSGQGQLSLPPDNQFHQVSLNAGYNVSDRTRLSASVSRGSMTQNDTFLPYTDIASLAASITQPLPRDSLNARIDTTVVNLHLSSRPWRGFAWNAAYRYDDRNNKTPRNEYVYIGGDSQLQNASLTSGFRRFNEPYSYRNEQFSVDASYRVLRHTDLRAGVQHSTIDRTYSERERANEDTYHFDINTEFTDRIEGQLRYTYAQRDGSTYVGSDPLYSGFSADYAATVAGGFENLPGLRKYFLANRDRQQLNASLSFTPTDAWTLSAAADHSRDKYNQSEFGLVGATTDSYTLDTVFAPSAQWSTFAYYTHQKMDSDQNGRAFSGGGAKLAQAADPNRNWFVNHHDIVDSYGIGFKRILQSGRFEFGGDYLYSKTRSDLNFAVGSALTTAPLPRDVTRLQSLKIHGTYTVRKNLQLRLNYWYEHYHSNDFAVDGIAPNTLANVILMGQSSPEYNIGVVSLSMIYHF
ncbi:MAG: MtrB/PioB family decaheme-associated outer membrane protein [Rhodanobacter sp.]